MCCRGRLDSREGHGSLSVRSVFKSPGDQLSKHVGRNEPTYACDLGW
jgi:hypothetical protein